MNAFDQGQAAFRQRQDRKDALKFRVDMALATPERRERKNHLGARVQAALVAAAAADPVLDFTSCDCQFHNVAVEQGDSLVASVFWRNR